jgi:uncharacterized protein (UPF0248 family)
MLHVRNILDEIKWRDGFSFEDLEIEYRDRIESRLITLFGSEIKDWDKSFIYTTKGGTIPFHRVEMITHKGEVMYHHEK